MLSSSGRTLHPLIPALLVLIAAVAWQAGANSANSARPPAAPTAVATVDIVTIFDQLSELKDMEGKVEARRNSSRAAIEEINNRLKTIQADLADMVQGTEEHRNKVKEAMELQAVYQARSEAQRE